MFKNLANGWKIINNSFLLFKKYPKFIIPFTAQQILSAPIILYIAFGRGYFLETYPLETIFLAIFFIAFLLTISCLILLELIEQIETKQPVNLWLAIKRAFVKDGLRALPLVIVWTILWFVLIILEAFLSKATRKTSNNFTPENSAKVLEGGTTTLSGGIFATLEKGIRMMMFLILPGIAWEGLGFAKATKQAFHIVRSHLGVFVSGFVLATAVQVIIFLPAGIIFTLADNSNVQFPQWVWFITIFYIFLAWSYTIYTEQMFSANLYLWNLRWQKAVQETPSGTPAPQFNDIPMPSLLNDTGDLLGIVKNTSPLSNSAG